jgi:pimeloyl-ACP methyl ester carboxylesterase
VRDKGSTFRGAGGSRIGYAEYGDPDGMPLLFFHGIPGSRLLGRALHDDALASGTRIVAPERPGCGLSDQGRARSVASCTRPLGELVDALGIDRLCALGVSGGGPYALACGAQLSGRVDAVGLVSSVGADDDPGVLLRSSRWLVALGRVSPLLAVPTLELARRRATRRLDRLREAIEAELRADGVDHPAAAELLVADLLEAFESGCRGVAGDCGRVRRWGFRPEDVRIRTFFWHGRDDRHVSVRAAEKLARRLPDCRSHLLAGEGHFGVLYRHGAEILDTLVAASRGVRAVPG